MQYQEFIDPHQLLDQLFEPLVIPPGRILFLHARLRRLHALTGCDYPQLTQAIIARLWRLQPRTILIPAYTIYGFLYSRVFHRQFSTGETGRFSEEVRQQVSLYRSPDPMYSVLDLGNYLPSLSGIDYHSTFSKQSLFQHLLEQDEIILNLDLDGVWCTHFHQAELAQAVDYRFLGNYCGVVYTDEQTWQAVNYQAYLRALQAGSAYPVYHRENTKRYLLHSGVMQQSQCATASLTWMSAQTCLAAIEAALAKNSHFLIRPPC